MTRQRVFWIVFVAVLYSVAALYNDWLAVVLIFVANVGGYVQGWSRS